MLQKTVLSIDFYATGIWKFPVIHKGCSTTSACAFVCSEIVLAKTNSWSSDSHNDWQLQSSLLYIMLPPIKYKIHPKMAEILQQKRKRREVLEQARKKQQAERHVLKQERKEYMEQNKQEIARKLTDIHQKKLIKHNFIREEEKERPIRIALKKSQRLIQLIPQRRQLIQQLKQDYLLTLQNSDKQKQAKIQQIIQARLIKPEPQFKLEQKLRENNIIDTNEGICVICLTSEAHLYMLNCRHLISCKDCQFILRLQKKCPLCRNFSQYGDLKSNKRVRKLSSKK